MGDMVPAGQRGGAMEVWSIGPMLDPVVGPVCTGFLVDAKGWRWVFWVTTIMVSYDSCTIDRDNAFIDN